MVFIYHYFYYGNVVIVHDRSWCSVHCTFTYDSATYDSRTLGYACTHNVAINLNIFEFSQMIPKLRFPIHTKFNTEYVHSNKNHHECPVDSTQYSRYSVTSHLILHYTDLCGVCTILLEFERIHDQIQCWTYQFVYFELSVLSVWLNIIWSVTRKNCGFKKSNKYFALLPLCFHTCLIWQMSFWLRRPVFKIISTKTTETSLRIHFTKNILNNYELPWNHQKEQRLTTNSILTVNIIIIRLSPHKK